MSKLNERWTLRGDMLMGGVWSFASVGWIALVALAYEWSQSGFQSALFGFGLVLLMGAGLFALAWVIAVICEVLDLGRRDRRRNMLHSFGWAFFLNALIGGLALFCGLSQSDDSAVGNRLGPDCFEVLVFKFNFLEIELDVGCGV